MTATDQQGSWERITSALESVVGPGRQSRDWTRYCCPAHEADGRGHNPSLGVKYDREQHKTVVRCFAGCDNEVVLDRIGLRVRDIYDSPRAQGGYRSAPQRPRTVSRADRAIDAAGLPLTKPHRDLGRQTSSAKKIASYPYVDADGQVVGEVVRKHVQHEHGRSKEFYQYRWNSQTGRMEPGGFDPIPFQLPEVLAAVADGRTIYVTEGEEDALAAGRAGLPATCNAAGAGKWRPEHAAYLTGARRVVIIADHDAPGYRHADRVAESLAGLVGEVRVVQALAGKDLRDHFAAGHEIGELEPVPGLDHRTPVRPTPGLSAEQIAHSAGAVYPAPTLTDPTITNLGGAPMGEISGLGMSEPVQHDDAVDHIGAKFSQLIQMLMAQIMQLAQQATQRRREEYERAKAEGEERERQYKARQAAERKTAETKLGKLREFGWERLSRSEIAEALREAATWAPDSPAAQRTVGELSEHIRSRYGVHVDGTSGHVTVDAPNLSGQLAAVEQDRATANRVRTAQDRMISMVAAEQGLDESAKAALYVEIEAWRHNPSGHSLDQLAKKMQAAGVGEETRTKVRFVALYLGTPGGADVPITALGAVAAGTSTGELRRLAEPLVDPGEECKPRVDALLVRYQDRLRHGLDTEAIRDQLAHAIAVMDPEDRKAVRDRGLAIRKDPAAEFTALWPNHVDREQLDQQIRMYALLQPQVELQSVSEQGIDAEWAVAQRDRTVKLRKDIDRALLGEGLHPLEVDQLSAVLADIEAGITAVPHQLFADDRSGAAVDRDRHDEIGRQVAEDHRRQLDQILSTGAVPREAARAATSEISNVVAAQTSLAAGRTSLGDYEESGADARLLAKLSAAGVHESTCNRVRNHLDRTSSDSAITGKQSRRIADKWTDRREKVAAGRADFAPTPYDSAERRSATEAGLRSAGLSDRSVQGRMAADAGHAQPTQAAVQNPAAGKRGARRTAPGSGVYRTNHRGRGDQRGYGK